MAGFGANPTTGTQGALATNQFPLSSVAVPGEASGNLTALEGGPENTDTNGNKTAPASMYVKDGGNIAQGTTTDAAWSGSGAGTEIAILKKLVAELTATLTVAGTITEANSASIKTDLDAINTAIGTQADVAWTSGNGTEIALLKKLIAELAGTIAVSGTFWQTTQPVSAASLPLPSNAAIETGGNLATIATNTTGGATQATLALVKTDLDNVVTNTGLLATHTDAGAINTTLGTLATQTTLAAAKADLDTIATQTASLATHADTTTLNTTLGTLATQATLLAAKNDLDTLVTNTADLLADGDHLATIDTSTARIPAQGQTLMATSMPVTLASNQSTVPTLDTNSAASKADLDTIVTNTTGIATQATLLAAKNDLDTIVTNTNKIPSSPATEGGNLASILTQVTNHAVTQGAGATAGTSWRIAGDYAEQTGLTAGSLNADLVPSTDVSAFKSFSLQILTVGPGCVMTFQGCNDNSSWQPVNYYYASNQNAPGNVQGSPGIYFGPLAFRYFRVRQTSYGSGSSTGILELYTQPCGIPGTNTTVNSTAQATGSNIGTTDFHLISAATTNASSVKGYNGQIYSYTLTNSNAALRYVKFHNTGSTPTPGSGVVRTVGVGANSTVVFTSTTGLRFSNGIGISTTTGIADTDSTAVGLNDLSIDIDYA